MRQRRAGRRRHLGVAAEHADRHLFARTGRAPRRDDRSEERRVGKEGRYWRDWSSDVCSSDLRMLRRNGCYEWVRWNTAVDPHRRLFYSVGVAHGPCDSGERVDVGTWEWRPSTQTVTCSRELVALLGVTTDRKSAV